MVIDCDHKHPGEDWSADEFVPTQARLPTGEAVAMKLAERGPLRLTYELVSSQNP